MDTEKNESQDSEIKISPEEFEKCKQERNEYLDGWKRAKADLINYKKDEEQRFKEFAQFNLSFFIKELITVLDSFDLGLTMLKEEDTAKKGIILIRSKFAGILKKFGLSEIIVSAGQSFDPNQHEAVGEVESEQPPGTIAEEVERGYLLNNKVIRPTKIKLSKGKGFAQNLEA
jgi:molecular chaperone GrpE